MRCLTLGSAWQDIGGNATLAAVELPSGLAARAESLGLDTENINATPGSRGDMEATVALAERRDAAWIVLDGYHFDADYQSGLDDAQPLSLWIDDLGRTGRLPIDALLNQNLHASPEHYPALDSNTDTLFGPEHALLRSEFQAWATWDREIPEAPDRVLVTLGGADPQGVTLTVLDALDHVDVEGLVTDLIIGSSFGAPDKLRARAETVTHDVVVHEDVDRMSDLMAQADLCVAAGGTTTWELLAMGLPTVQLVLADNQTDIARSLDQADLAEVLGRPEDLTVLDIAERIEALAHDPSRRRDLATRARRIVDGHGAHRVATYLQERAL